MLILKTVVLDVLCFGEGLTEVCEDVGDVLDADGETDEVGSYSCLKELFVGKLAMGVTGWVQHARLGICHMSNDANHFQ